MNVIGERNPVLWGIEVLIALFTTFMFLPVLLLYLLDLFAGTIAPDATWAFAVVIALVGIWIALLRPDSSFQRTRRLRWSVIGMLLIGAAVFADLAWGSHPPGGMGYALRLLTTFVPPLLVLHQLVRLFRLPDSSGAERL